MGMLRPLSWNLSLSRYMVITNQAVPITIGLRSTMQNPDPITRSWWYNRNDLRNIGPRSTDNLNHVILIRGIMILGIRCRHPDSSPSLHGRSRR